MCPRVEPPVLGVTGGTAGKELALGMLAVQHGESGRSGLPGVQPAVGRWELPENDTGSCAGGSGARLTGWGRYRRCRGTARGLGAVPAAPGHG